MNQFKIEENFGAAVLVSDYSSSCAGCLCFAHSAICAAAAAAPPFATCHTPFPLFSPHPLPLLFTLRQRLKLPKCYKFFVVKRS